MASLIICLVLALPNQAPTPPQAPLPPQTFIHGISQKEPTVEQRWMQAYGEILTGKRTRLNIGNEFPSNYLGFEDGDYECTVRNGKPFLQLIPVLRTNRPISYLPTQSVTVCRT